MYKLFIENCTTFKKKCIWESWYNVFFPYRHTPELSVKPKLRNETCDDHTAAVCSYFALNDRIEIILIITQAAVRHVWMMTVRRSDGLHADRVKYIYADVIYDAQQEEIYLMLFYLDPPHPTPVWYVCRKNNFQLSLAVNPAFRQEIHSHLQTQMQTSQTCWPQIDRSVIKKQQTSTADVLTCF